MIFNIPNEKELDKLLIQNDVSDLHTWEDKVLEGIATLIGNDPTRYRSYGPFWWPIKDLLRVKGCIKSYYYDESRPLIYSDKRYNLAAGLLLSIEWATKYFGENEFILKSEGVEQHYILEDPDMEAMLLFKSNV